MLRRCGAALYPRRPFLDVLDGNPDLYGPFWIATTVVFILFVAGYVSQYLSRRGGVGAPYDFRLLSGAAGIVYGYTFAVPVALWGVLRWFGGEGASLLECWALYGYANLIWIPVALVSWSPLTALNWLVVAAGLVVSALFLVRNLWPVVSAADRKVSRILVVVVVVLHAALAVTIKFFFFAWALSCRGVIEERADCWQVWKPCCRCQRAQKGSTCRRKAWRWRRRRSSDEDVVESMMELWWNCKQWDYRRYGSNLKLASSE